MASWVRFGFLVAVELSNHPIELNGQGRGFKLSHMLCFTS